MRTVFAAVNGEQLIEMAEQQLGELVQAGVGAAARDHLLHTLL